MPRLENEISTYRKTSEMIEELKEAIASLEAQRTTLRDNILASLKKADYNVCRYKTLAMGKVGRNLFTVGFGKRIERRSGKSLDDQTWLESLGAYTHSRLILEKDVLKVSLRDHAEVVEPWMRQHDLCVAPTMNLSVQLMPTDVELNALREEARRMVESADAKEDAA